MPLNLSYELHKIKREIRIHGTDVEFKRSTKNEFCEPTNDLVTIGKASVIYHEQNSNVQVTTGETTQIRTKKIPMIMFPFHEFEKMRLKTGDYVCFNGKRFLISGVVNVQEWNIIADVSLEVLDYGDYIK